MAGGKGNYLENKVLDHVFGVTSYTAPATVQVALYTVTPSDTGGGTEVTGGSYARVTVTNSGTNWNTAASGATSNKTTVTFAKATADWGTVVAFAIWDSANLLYWGPVTPSKVVSTDDTPSFAAGDLSITED